jgi:hypothetical protein
MQLPSLKSTIAAVLSQSETLSPGERQTALAQTCQVLALLLETPGESGPGWPKAALTLLRPPIEQPAEARIASGTVSMSSRSTSRMLALRTAPAPSLAELQERLLTVLLLPDVTQVESLDDLRAPIEQAIALGAPAYNRGDVAGCARLYLATALTLIHAQAMRGFPGQAKALDVLKNGASEAYTQTDIDERAWTLRHAFDRILK